MEMPKIGVSTSPLRDLISEVENIGKMGMDFVELTIEEPMGVPYFVLRYKDKIRKLAERHKMYLTGHAAWWIELGTPHEAVRKSWVEESKDIIDSCQMVGVRSLNFHINVQGSALLKNKDARKRVLDSHVKSLKELVAYGRRRKVEILLENIPKRDKFSVVDMKYILDRVKGLGMTLDIAHAFVEGGTKKVMEYIEVCGKRIRHVHVGDNNGKMDQHLAVGDGKIPWKKVLKGLKDIGYSRGIVLEVFYSRKKNAYTDSRKRILEIWKGLK